MGARIALTRPAGSIRTPAYKADRARDPCIKIGSKYDVAKIVKNPITTNSVPAVNIGYLKARRFMIGCFIVS
ncbi:hypothetical protein D3C73_1263210 [compost metagenome]